MVNYLKNKDDEECFNSVGEFYGDDTECSEITTSLLKSKLEESRERLNFMTDSRIVTECVISGLKTQESYKNKILLTVVLEYTKISWKFWTYFGRSSRLTEVKDEMKLFEIRGVESCRGKIEPSTTTFRTSTTTYSPTTLRTTTAQQHNSTTAVTTTTSAQSTIPIKSSEEDVTEMVNVNSEEDTLVETTSTATATTTTTSKPIENVHEGSGYRGNVYDDDDDEDEDYGSMRKRREISPNPIFQRPKRKMGHDFAFEV